MSEFYTEKDLVNLAASQVQSGVSLGGSVPAALGLQIDPDTGAGIPPPKPTEPTEPPPEEITATGATAGIPGSFTPEGATPPADVASMAGIVADPDTPWTTGQFVQTGTAGAAGRTCWSGTDWVGGIAP